LRYSNTTRLLVDLNRSLGHPRLFSEITRPLDSTARLQIIDRHYLPYRGAVEERVRELLDRHGRVLHLSIHSFTPVWKGAPRVAGIGLLYDPCRKPEQRLAKAWQAALSESAPQLRVRRNYPYLGKADGFAAYLRRKLSARVYRGIEVELNQALFASASAPRMLARLLAETLETARR
jgi:predicted N-formylglutamate amidohydrolase